MVDKTGWATNEDCQDDINRDLLSIDRVDEAMLTSQRQTAKGYILAIIGDQYRDYDVDNTIWGIHKEASINQIFYKLNQMGVKGFEAPEAILTDEHIFILENWKDNNPVFDEEDPFELPFAEENPDESQGHGTFWYGNGGIN